MSEPAPTTIPGVPTAAPPAPHQVAAFSAARLSATIMTICGAIVTIGGAVLPYLTSLLGAGSHYVIIAGAIITAAGRYEAAQAHAAFQQATDNA